MSTATRAKASQRAFTWGVKTMSINFMRTSDADAAIDGNSGSTSDCSMISRFDKPKKKRPAKPGSQP